MDTLAESAIADPVVCLQERDERAGPRGSLRRLFIWEQPSLTLENETLCQRAPELLDRCIGEVGVVTLDLAGDQLGSQVHGVAAAHAWFTSCRKITSPP